MTRTTDCEARIAVESAVVEQLEVEVDDHRLKMPAEVDDVKLEAVERPWSARALRIEDQYLVVRSLLLRRRLLRNLVVADLVVELRIVQN